MDGIGDEVVIGWGYGVLSQREEEVRWITFSHSHLTLTGEASCYIIIAQSCTLYPR